jgi:putative FmdB family regulatory protein
MRENTFEVFWYGRWIPVTVSPYARGTIFITEGTMSPQYDYACPKCDTKKTEILSLSEYDPSFQPICPECHESMEREIAASPGKVYGYSADNGYSWGC